MAELARETSIPDDSNVDRGLDHSNLRLVLPISSDMSHSTVPKAERRDERSRTRSTSNLEGYQERKTSRILDRMVVKLDDRLLPIHLQDVHWIQSKGNLICLHLQNGDYDCRITMKNISMMLDPNCFLRVHRNAIVNLDYVVEFDLPRYGNAFVRLQGGKALPISRTGRGRLRSRLLSRACMGGYHQQTLDSCM